MRHRQPAVLAVWNFPLCNVKMGETKWYWKIAIKDIGQFVYGGAGPP